MPEKRTDKPTSVKFTLNTDTEVRKWAKGANRSYSNALETLVKRGLEHPDTKAESK